MNQSSEKSQNIQGFLRILYCELGWGWRAFLVAKYVNQARTDNRFNSVHNFFGTAYYSCSSYAILALAKLFDKHRDAISINYLLNYSEQNTDAFPHARREAVSRSVPEHRKKLATIAPIVENILEQRDRMIVHLDKRLVKKPADAFTHPHLDLIEVEGVFDLLFGILNTYCRHLGSEFVNLDYSRHGVAGDFEYLIGLIEKANKEDLD